MTTIDEFMASGPPPPAPTPPPTGEQADIIHAFTPGACRICSAPIVRVRPGPLPRACEGTCRTEYERLKKRRRKGTKRPRAGLTVAQRFWADVDRSGGPLACWPHGMVDTRGYVQVTIEGRQKYVHVYAYELAVGPVPDGHQIDHLCHTLTPTCVETETCPHRRCANPAHLEPVTPGENQRRARERTLGLEWDTVRLASDLTVEPDEDGELDVAELRLLYVAVTRARLGLDVGGVPLTEEGMYALTAAGGEWR